MENNTHEIYHSDHLGSSSYITDNFGRPSHYYEYLPFGELMTEHNQSKYYLDPYPTQNMDSYNNPYKFNGKEMDRETGMYYYGARYYDPRISIFVSVDPLAEEFPNYGGYVYTMNNPVNLIDPTGMAPEENDGWIIKKSRRDGNTIVMYDSSVNNMEEAKRKGYRDVEGVLETGYFIGEDDVWRLEDNAMIYGENSGIVKNVGFEGYRANDGTFFQENNQLKSLASGLQNGGTALTYIGIGASITKVGAPVGALMMTIGEGMNLVGTGIEFAYLYSEGHKKEAMVKLGISLLFVGSGNLGIKATQKAVGRETLDTGSETLIKSTNTVIENTIGKDTEEMLNKKRH